MPIGPTVRRALGPFERPISEAYRGAFINLKAFGLQIYQWYPHAKRILEIGCGEGAVIERLQKHYPDAQILGIDITPNAGRMFRGDTKRITFKQQTVQELAESSDKLFDLIIMSDVLHHVPWEMHEEILSSAHDLLATDGKMVLKDFEKTGTPIYYLCLASDRYITGDDVRYKTAAQFRQLIHKVFGQKSIVDESWIKPWRNNIAFLLKREKVA